MKASLSSLSTFPCCCCQGAVAAVAMASLLLICGSVASAVAQSSSTAARSSVRADPQELAAIRREVLQLINEQRTSNKLAPLAPDPILGREAQKHSDTMAAGGSGPGGGPAFSHDGYAERFAAIRADNPTVTSMGENIGFQDAGAKDKASSIVSLWMRSPSHKKNILGEFTVTGLGIATASDGRLYMTQIFCSGTNSANAKKAMETYTDAAALERDIVDLVNRYRATKKLKPLASDADLRRLALAHSADMASGKVKVSHDGFRGRFDAFRKANPLGAAMGENVATNFPGPNAARNTVQNWIDSPEHRKNMEGAEFSLTGVGVLVSKSGTIYFTQLFAKVMPPPPPPEAGTATGAPSGSVQLPGDQGGTPIRRRVRVVPAE